MRITHSSVESHDGRWTVTRQFFHDDGTIEDGVHVFPLDTLEWRAAEYNIDPGDVDTLLDIVLMEPYLTPEDWALGFRLHDAPDVATARQDHLARCARVKLRHRVSTRSAPAVGLGARAADREPPAHPLDPIRRDHGIDPGVIAVKAEYVANLRRAVVIEREQRAREMPLGRAEQVRRELGLPAPARPGREEGPSR